MEFFWPSQNIWALATYFLVKNKQNLKKTTMKKKTGSLFSWPLTYLCIGPRYFKTFLSLSRQGPSKDAPIGMKLVMNWHCWFCVFKHGGSGRASKDLLCCPCQVKFWDMSKSKLKILLTNIVSCLFNNSFANADFFIHRFHLTCSTQFLVNKTFSKNQKLC